MGSKKNKLKKLVSPATPPPPIMDAENEDLMNDLLAQLDSADRTVQSESAIILEEMNLNQQADRIEASHRQDAKSRFKARQARKAATIAQSLSPDNPEHDARIAQEAKDEDAAIRAVCKELGLELIEINPDGHCLFSAVADQLALLGILPPSKANYASIRIIAADYIHSHPDHFLPFLPSTGGEDSAGAEEAGLMTTAQFDAYCQTIRDTATWGGEPEIVALSHAYNIPIHVVQGGKPSIVEHQPHGRPLTPGEPILRISYHRKLYGLGEHYNSLRPLKTLVQ